MTSLYDFLCVDRYLRTQLEVRALDYALSSGLIDRLLEHSYSFDEIPIGTEFGKHLILDTLEHVEVISRSDGFVSLAVGFRNALLYRDLLESKIAFADYVAADIAGDFAALIDDLPAFMAKSHTFALFRYDRCFVATEPNVAVTRTWMRFTTTLTRYEGRVLAELVDLSGIDRVLDIGGNSGELARQLCQHRPRVTVTVADLPLVCAIGSEHIADLVAAGRVAFHTCDIRRDSLPAPYDVVVLKSVLHDWPADDARMLLGRAFRACRPGGRVVIFERGRMRAEEALTYGQISNLVFAPFYRDASLYVDVLRALGCKEVEVQTIRLEMDFHLLVATRPA